ncbi:MAG: diguanylate cyclase [Candidatus Viridilinea halotolerans]|uniref:Diguanylate cyclase n=1 Tax=Candidatus Viridilinea halotolerans TaxID=2491704 RepID=A0A426U9Z6_9CHLR|nr:MAG: diguanylate cyclase [Candidatus Viridilinea halotolerans]
MSKPRVLIVEDELITALDLEETLQRLGYEVSGVADTGTLALAMASQHPPDLVLMDITLRGSLDGVMVAEQLRKQFDLPVIYLTAHTDTPTVERAVQSGSFGYLIKPFDDNELQIALSMARAKYAVERELRQTQVQLQATVEALERRNAELHVLHRLASDLQLATTSGEACVAMVGAVREFFPEAAGLLLIHRERDGQIEPIFSWGAERIVSQAFPAQICPALQRRQLEARFDAQACAQCVREAFASTNEIYCVPLATVQERVGILLLHHPEAAQPTSDGDGTTAADRRRLAAALADQASLGLSNVLLRDALREQANRDPLTGLFNRRYLDEVMRREIVRARRENYPIALALLDIDHFKKINDNFGHSAGDAMLCSVARLLRDAVRGSDIVCRYGGEEFLIVLPLTNAEAVLDRTEQMRLTIKQLLVEHDGKLLPSITVSAGITTIKSSEDELQPALERADHALYVAKAAGRDRSVCVDA